MIHFFSLLLCLKYNLHQNFCRKCPSNLIEGFHLQLKCWLLSAQSFSAIKSGLGACFWWKNSEFWLFFWLVMACRAEKMLEWKDAFKSLFSLCIVKLWQSQGGKGRFYNCECSSGKKNKCPWKYLLGFITCVHGRQQLGVEQHQGNRIDFKI